MGPAPGRIDASAARAGRENSARKVRVPHEINCPINQVTYCLAEGPSSYQIMLNVVVRLCGRIPDILLTFWYTMFLFMTNTYLKALTVSGVCGNVLSM